MTIGNYLDSLVRGMLDVLTPWTSLGLGVLVAGIAFTRWWVNNYNVRRAWIYSQGVILSCLAFIVLGIIAVQPKIDHVIAWDLFGIFIWMTIAFTGGFYLAAAMVSVKGWSSSKLKTRMAAWLRKQADKLEESIRVADYETAKTIEKKLEKVKEVLIENKDLIALL